MSRPRTALWTILLVALAGAIGYRLNGLRQPPPPPPVVIAFVTGGNEGYWQMTANGAKAAARKEGVDLHLEMPAENENVDQQTELLSKLDSKKLDGVAVSPLDAEGQTELINKIGEQTKIVTFDSDAPDSKRLSYIGTSNFSAGRTCARLVTEALPNGGKVAVLLANLTKDNLRDRKGGFAERIAQYADDVEPGDNAPKFVVVDYLIDNGSAQKCAQNIRDEIAKHADLDCFVGMNAAHGPVLVKTLKDAGKLGRIKLVTFDVADETLDGIEQGQIFATVAQDPYQFGYEAVSLLAALSRGDEVGLPIVGKGSLSVSAEPINQSNLAEFRTRLKAQRDGSAKKGNVRN
jgi:ribose transport system substrate-binding protein